MPKSQNHPPKRAGRKPLSAHGKEARTCKLVASFTPTQYAALEADAEDEGVTIAELVAQRATGDL